MRKKSDTKTKQNILGLLILYERRTRTSVAGVNALREPIWIGDAFPALLRYWLGSLNAYAMHVPELLIALHNCRESLISQNQQEISNLVIKQIDGLISMFVEKIWELPLNMTLISAFRGSSTSLLECIKEGYAAAPTSIFMVCVSALGSDFALSSPLLHKMWGAMNLSTCKADSSKLHFFNRLAAIDATIVT